MESYSLYYIMQRWLAYKPTMFGLVDIIYSLWVCIFASCVATDGDTDQSTLEYNIKQEHFRAQITAV